MQGAPEISPVLEAAPDAMVVVDDQGRIVYVNAQTERVFGFTREELLGRGVEMLVPADRRSSHAAHRNAYAEDPHPRAMGGGRELHGQRKNGDTFLVEISLSPWETGGRTFVISAIRDITERRRAELDASHYAAVVESSTDAIVATGPDGKVTSWNQGARRLYGYAVEEVIGKPVDMLTPPGRDDELGDMLRRAQAGERIENFETVQARKDGTQVDVSLTISPIRTRRGDLVGVASIARDITARLRHQEQLRFLADHDALTGARNRRRLERDLGEQLGRARRYNEPASLLLLDVDGFKTINDRHGHRAGDLALKRLASILRERLRESDLVARIGGDEFAVLLPYADRFQAEAVARDLQELLAAATVTLADGQSATVPLQVSIGVASIDATSTIDGVLAEADQQMYEQKRRRTARG